MCTFYSLVAGFRFCPLFRELSKIWHSPFQIKPVTLRFRWRATPRPHSNFTRASPRSSRVVASSSWPTAKPIRLLCACEKWSRTMRANTSWSLPIAMDRTVQKCKCMLVMRRVWISELCSGNESMPSGQRTIRIRTGETWRRRNSRCRRSRKSKRFAHTHTYTYTFYYYYAITTTTNTKPAATWASNEPSVMSLVYLAVLRCVQCLLLDIAGNANRRTVEK